MLITGKQVPLHPEFSVVVPVHNEEILIGTFLTDTDKACRETGRAYEIIVVENGCTDRTEKITAELKKKLVKVKTYSLPKPGYGEALLYGANKARGKFTVIFNADFWDKKFLTVTEKDMQNYDLVVGSKMLPGSQDMRPFFRKTMSFIFNKFLNIYFGYPGTESHGIKVMRNKTVLPVFNSCKTRSGIIDTELMVRAYRKKLKVLELPVRIKEIRPPRFGYKRLVQTPADIWNLIKALA